MKRAELEEARVRERERREEVRRDEEGQAFAGGQKQRRRLYLQRARAAAAQLEHSCPRHPVAPCLHCVLHRLSLSLSPPSAIAGRKTGFWVFGVSFLSVGDFLCLMTFSRTRLLYVWILNPVTSV